MKSFLTFMKLENLDGEDFAVCVGKVKARYFDTLSEIIEKLNEKDSEKPKTLEIHVKECIGTVEEQT